MNKLADVARTQLANNVENKTSEIAHLKEWFSILNIKMRQNKNVYLYEFSENVLHKCLNYAMGKVFDILIQKLIQRWH